LGSRGATLFFVIVLAHIQRRSELPGVSLVYIEKFHLMMDFVIIAVVANAYLSRSAPLQADPGAR
jgi:hypothetical protein